MPSEFVEVHGTKFYLGALQNWGKKKFEVKFKDKFSKHQIDLAWELIQNKIRKIKKQRASQ